jgi:hypothetical protein
MLPVLHARPAAKPSACGGPTVRALAQPNFMWALVDWFPATSMRDAARQHDRARQHRLSFSLRTTACSVHMRVFRCLSQTVSQSRHPSATAPSQRRYGPPSVAGISQYRGLTRMAARAAPKGLRLRPRWLARCLPLQCAGLLHGTIDISGGLVHSINYRIERERRPSLMFWSDDNFLHS